MFGNLKFENRTLITNTQNDNQWQKKKLENLRIEELNKKKNRENLY
jgi:hypothetical protein